MNFKEELKKRTESVDRMLEKFLPAEEGFAAGLAEAMNYSVRAGGKRLRPLLMWETYRLFGGGGQVVAPFMAAMELIHTHSLVHDDLPAVDDDEYRRGKRTTHAVYGEAMGILSGDALLNYAYEAALHAFDVERDNPGIVPALQILAAKAGIFGMLGGQSVDVTNEGREISGELLRYIYENKTAALIEGSMMVGAALAGASDADIIRVESIGKKVGLAFQIRDDILDVTGTQETIGKPVGSDEKNHKTTYVTLYGLETACREVDSLSAAALGMLDELPGENPFLRELLASLAGRMS